MRKVEVQLTEHIASMLPHGIKLDGGIITQAPDAVAGALGMARLSRGAELLMRVKHMYEQQFTCELHWEGFKKVWAESANNFWGVNFPAKYLPIIVKVAMQEAIEERMICMECGGSGFIMDRDRVLPCRRCGTTGYIQFDRIELARRAGLRKKDINANWRQAYDYALRVFREFELEIEKGLAKHLIGDRYYV